MSGPLALGFVNDFRPSPGVCFVVASGSHHLCSPRPSCSAPRDPRALTRLRAPLKARRGLRLEVVISVAARLAVSVFSGRILEWSPRAKVYAKTFICITSLNPGNNFCCAFTNEETEPYRVLSSPTSYRKYKPRSVGFPDLHMQPLPQSSRITGGQQMLGERVNGTHL